jgi:hypothetical protein
MNVNSHALLAFCVSRSSGSNGLRADLILQTTAFRLSWQKYPKSEGEGTQKWCNRESEEHK